ncbi:MAG: YbjN domain-containing protein [Actinomycetota bacterium]|nr:YbjN domain-containing protein [Actinomycetota bacterium]
MSKGNVVQSHVEALCERMLETDELRVGSAGEIAVAHRSAVYQVRVLAELAQPHVEVSAIVLDDVDADPGLYEALNGINARAAHFRAFWADRKVVFAAVLVGETLALEELSCTCDEVGSAAHGEGPALVAVYGGRLARPDYSDEEGQ